MAKVRPFKESRIVDAARVPPDEIRRQLHQLAEICLEAHAVVQREGPAEVRTSLEDLLDRLGGHLAAGRRAGGA